MTDETRNPPGMVGRHALMLEAYRRIHAAARTRRPVLTVGETGTGKELVARAVHALGERAGAPFEALNCAALPEGLVEAELFGAEKGAYTGADRRRLGAFGRANGGTLFLDELDAMLLHLQAKLLRVLQEHHYYRLGGEQLLRADIRVVVGVSRPLNELVATRRLREDLAYRVRGVTIHLPPLRERRSDILLLTGSFLRGPKALTPAAQQLLLRYSWPGNVRELQQVIENLVALVPGEVIDADDVLRELEAAPLARGDRTELAALLLRHGMNTARAARAVGLSRSTLQRWLAEVELVGNRRPGRPRDHQDDGSENCPWAI